MPDQIDLSKMQSTVAIGPNGHLRLNRHWKEPGESMWDGIWGGTVSSGYWAGARHGQLDRDYEEVLIPHLKPAGRVLEAGCGLGHVMLALRARGFDCHGLDFAKETVSLLTREFPDVPVTVGDVRALPYPDSSFDAYISLGVIEHFIAGQDQILRESARVVRPGGCVALAVPAFNAFRRLRHRFGSYRDEVTMPFFEACLSKDEVLHLLRQAGLTPVAHRFMNPLMTFMQETPLRPVYRLVEDRRFVRAVIDRVVGRLLPRPFFGHMVIVVGRKGGG